MTISNNANANKANRAVTKGVKMVKLTTRQEAAALAAKEKKEKEQAAETRRLQEEKEKVELARKKREEKGKEGKERAATTGDGSNKDVDTEEKDETAEEKKKREERSAEERRAGQNKASGEAEGTGTGGGGNEDKPDENINELLTQVNGGGEDVVDLEEGEESEREEGRSPRKKRTKKAKKTARKERKAARKAKEAIEKEAKKTATVTKTTKRKEPEPEHGEDPPPSSSLKPGRFTNAGHTPGLKVTSKKVVIKDLSEFKFQRVYAEASAVLTNEDDRYTELTMDIRLLIREAQKVDDGFIILPVVDGEEDPILATPNEVPLNQTDLQANIKLAANASFEKRRPWGKKANEVEEEDMEDPEVNFSFCFACDVHPRTIFERILSEWRKNGGKRLFIKKLRTHNPKQAIVLYEMFNKVNVDTVQAEAIVVLTLARDMEERDTTAMNDEDFKWGEEPIPEIGIARRVPMIPGLDTSTFDKMPWKMKEDRKCLHITTDTKHVIQVQDLVEIAKDRGLIAPVWGRKVRPSNVLVTKEKDLPEGGKVSRDFEINAVKSFTRDHVNYHSSMTTHGLSGIWDLEKQAALYIPGRMEVEGFLSLRMVLYKKMVMADNHPLIAELHQLMPMTPVEVVHPNCEEAEKILLNMEKNVVAYLQYYLVEEGMDSDFVDTLLREACDPSLFHTAGDCEWDTETKTLITPEDREKEKEADMTKAKWYKDDFGDFLSKVGKRDKKGGEKKQYADPENIYKLDDERSVDTVRAKPGSSKPKATGYGGSPGAPAFKVGGKKGQEEDAIDTVDIDSDNEEEADKAATASDPFGHLSRDELVEQLKKATLSSKPTGSAPNTGNGWDHSESSDEEGSSSSGSFSDSSSGSSDESTDEGLNGPPSG